MKKFITIVLLFSNLSSFCQSIESITEKVTSKICICMNDTINSYSEIKTEFNRCYDKEFNNIFSIVDSNEQKILLENGAIDKINNGIVQNLNITCEKNKKNNSE